jgi:hypothetical protein
METRNDLSRMTVDIPIDTHRKLKALSALLGKSMRDVVIESLQAHLQSVNASAANKDVIKKIGM